MFRWIGEVQVLTPGSKLFDVTLVALNRPEKLTVPVVTALDEELPVALMSVNVTARLNGTLVKLSGCAVGGGAGGGHVVNDDAGVAAGDSAAGREIDRRAAGWCWR